MEYLEAERVRRGDSLFGQSTEDRIVWSELLELELQDIDALVIESAAPRTTPPDRTRIHAKEVLMTVPTHEPLNLNAEELAILAELLESASTKLLVDTPPPITGHFATTFAAV